MWFPIDSEKGIIDPSTGLWVVTFGGYNTDRLVQWISLQGPPSSTCNVYVNTIFVDITARGDYNRADYYQGIPLSRGSQFFLKWDTGSGNAPIASLGMTDGKAPSELLNTGSIFTAG